MTSSPTRRRPAALPLLVLTLTLLTAPVHSAELTAFFGTGNPSEDWGTGYGGALSSTLFEVVSFEGEIGLLRGDTSGVAPELSMTSFTASALLSPPVGALVPYGGIGFGLFRQSDGSLSDTGKLRAFIFGVKLGLGVISIRGDYRSITLTGDPLLKLDSRFYLGASVSF